MGVCVCVLVNCVDIAFSEGLYFSAFIILISNSRPTTEDDSDLINTSHYEESSTSSNDEYSLQGTYLDYSKVALCVLSCLAKVSH